MYTVYKHTFPNGKVYIGITSQNPNNRWRKGDGYKGNEMLFRAINKYGWENIKHEILNNNLTKEEAEAEEKRLIKQYNSNNRKFGYNICSGGGVNVPTEETKLKIAKSHIGKTHSEETKRKMSELKKGVCLSEKTRYNMSLSRKGKKRNPLSEETKEKIRQKHIGKKANEETKKKMSVSHSGKNNAMYGKKGKNNPNSKPVICVETGTEYASSAEVERLLALHSTSITQVCKGKRETCGGYHWRYKNV